MMTSTDDIPAPRLSGRIGQVIGLNVTFTHNGVATNPFAIRRIDIYKNSELDHHKVAEIHFPDPRSGSYPLPALTDPTRPGYFQVNWLVPQDFQEGLYFDVWRFIGSDPGITALGSECPCDPVIEGSAGEFGELEHNPLAGAGDEIPFGGSGPFVINPEPELEGHAVHGEIFHHRRHCHDGFCHEECCPVDHCHGEHCEFENCGDDCDDCRREHEDCDDNPGGNKHERLTLEEAEAVIHHEVHEEQEGPEPEFGGFHHDREMACPPNPSCPPSPPICPPRPPVCEPEEFPEHHLLCDESRWFKQCNKFYLYPDGWFLDDGLIVPRFGFEPLDARFRKGEIRTLEVGIMPLPLYDFDANRIMPLIPRFMATISIETENAETLVADQPCRIGLRQGSVRSNPYVIQATLDASSFLIGTYVYRIKVGLPNGETRVSEPFRFSIV